VHQDGDSPRRKNLQINSHEDDEESKFDEDNDEDFIDEFDGDEDFEGDE
jgi:hypothetical protein